jgi:hypothetical protein
MLKRLYAVLVLGAVMFSTAQVAAQALSDPPAPLWPSQRQMSQPEATYYGPAMKGWQIIGEGSYCLTAQSMTQNAPLTMEGCVANLVTQRFNVVVQDGISSVRLASNILVVRPNPPKPPNLPPNAPWPTTSKGYLQACLTANDSGQLRIDVCRGPNINPAHQSWEFKRPTIHSGPFCLDIADNKKGAGAKLIAWRCHGGNNQLWDLIQGYGPTK